VYRAWWQAAKATDGRNIMVVSKQDRTEPLVTIALADLLALLARLGGHVEVEAHPLLDGKVEAPAHERED